METIDAPAACHMEAKVGPAERNLSPFTSAGLRMQPFLDAMPPDSHASDRTSMPAFASRAMICTISSRTSPLPPGNWWEARSVTFAATAFVPAAMATAHAKTVRVSLFMGFLLVVLDTVRRPGEPRPGCVQIPPGI